MGEKSIDNKTTRQSIFRLPPPLVKCWSIIICTVFTKINGGLVCPLGRLSKNKKYYCETNAGVCWMLRGVPGQEGSDEERCGGETNCNSQMDCIDMHSNPDGEFRYIMVYQVPRQY